MFKAVFYVFKKVFNVNNVITPIKFLLKLVLGQSFTENKNKTKSFDYLEQLWSDQQNNNNDPIFPKKIFGLNPALFKSLFLAVIGVLV